MGQRASRAWCEKPLLIEASGPDANGSDSKNSKPRLQGKRFVHLKAIRHSIPHHNRGAAYVESPSYSIRFGGRAVRGCFKYRASISYGRLPICFLST